MKNKKLLLSVLSTAVVASMASSAFAAEAGIYIGGDVKHYYNISSFFEPTNSAKIVSEANSAKLKNVVFVDTTGKAATLDNILASGSAALTDDLEAVFGDSLHDAYVPVDKNGQEGTDPVVPEPSDSPSVDGLTQVVDGGKVTISGNAVNADSVEVTVFKASEKVATKSVDVADNKFSVDFADLVAGDYTYEVVASNADEDSEVKSGSFKVEAPAELKVDSVSAINAKQVEIKFNLEVDKASAEDLTNYNVYNQGNTTVDLSDDTATASAKLQADNKTVILTLEAAGVFANESTANVVQVLKGLKAANGTVLADDVTKSDVSFLDTTLPNIDKVEQVSANQVKIYFTEPVQDNDISPTTFEANEVTIDGGGFPVNTITADVATKSLTVTTFANLTDGEHTVKVVSNALKDYVNLPNIELTKKFTAKADTSVPTVSVKAATAGKVTLAFSKPLVIPANDNVAFRAVYNNTGNQVLAFTNAAMLFKADGVTPYDNSATSELVVDFPVDLPPGNVDIYIEYVSTTDTTNVIKDTFGVTLPEQKVVATTVVDTVKPEVAKVARVNNTTVDVTFNEAVEAASANLATNYTVTTATGSSVAVNAANLQADNKTVRLTTANLTGGTYTLVVKNVKDRAVPTANTMNDYSTTFTADDALNPTVSSVQFVNGDGVTAKDKLVIKYSEAMATIGAGSVSDKLNYFYTVDGVNYNNLGTNDKVEVSADAKTVTITFASDVTWSGTPAENIVKFGAVTDLKGNRLISSTTIGYTQQANSAAVGVLSAAFIARDKVKVVFDSVLANVDASEFALAQDNDGTPLAINLSVLSHTVANGQSTVTFALGTPVTYDAQSAGNNVALAIAGAVNTKTADGITVGTLAYDGAFADEDATANVIVDSIAPALATTDPITTVDADNDGYIDHIRVEYQEAVSDATLNLNSFTVAGYTVESVFADDDTNPVDDGRTDGNYVYIKVKEKTTADTGATPQVTRVGTVKDLAGNEFTGLTTATASVDKALPVLMSAALSDATTTSAGIDSDDTITLTFSEAMDTTTLGNVVMTTAGTLEDENGAFAAFGTAGTATVDTLGKAWGNGNKVLTLTTSGTIANAAGVPSGNVTPDVTSGLTDANGNEVNVTPVATSGSFTTAP